MYTFKPFVFKKCESHSYKRPKARSGHRIVCDHMNLYSYGGFNPCIRDGDPDMINDFVWRSSKPLFKEIWKFNFGTKQWKLLPGRDKMPNELASNAMILRDNHLMVYGGSGVPFGNTCSNHLYACDLHIGDIYKLPAKGNLPEPLYGQALIYHKSYLYTVGGTTGYEYNCDIYRYDLKTFVWETVYICSGKDQSEPAGRYRHELAFDGKLIYVLGGGTAAEAFGFIEIPAFNLETQKWVMLNTYGDTSDNSFPEPRRCHGSVQYTDDKTGVTYVVISGGYNGDHHIFSDVWRLDLNRLQWTCLRKCTLPSPVYFHSAALTPARCMYTFGGIIKENNKIVRTAAVHRVWLTIPELAEICWEAVIHYYPQIAYRSLHELLNMGIPLKYARRIS